MKIEYLKYIIIIVVLGITFDQATSRAANTARAEERLEQAEAQDSITRVLTARADSATALAIAADSAAARQARLDSALIVGLQGAIDSLSATADSVGGELADHLEDLDPQLAIDFDNYRRAMETALATSQEETRVEREAKEAASARALLWQQSDERKNGIIASQVIQIENLKAATDAALAAANPGLWPRLQADWWVGAIGFGLGVLATR